MIFVNTKGMDDLAAQLLKAKEAAAKAKARSDQKTNAKPKPQYEKGKLYFGKAQDGAICIDCDPSLATLVADNELLEVNETGKRFHPHFGWVNMRTYGHTTPKKEPE